MRLMFLPYKGCFVLQKNTFRKTVICTRIYNHRIYYIFCTRIYTMLTVSVCDKNLNG